MSIPAPATWLGLGNGAMSEDVPPMIAWQRAGEPGWPFNWPEWLAPCRELESVHGEQFELFAPFSLPDPSRSDAAA